MQSTKLRHSYSEAGREAGPSREQEEMRGQGIQVSQIDKTTQKGAKTKESE